MVYWKIQAWIPVDTEEPEIFNTREEAEEEVEHLQLLQPENIYEIEEAEGSDKK